MNWYINWANVRNFWLGVFFTIGLLLGFFYITNPVELSNLIASPIYHTYTYMDRNDPFVKNVSEFCRPFEGEDLVDCVVAQVEPYVNYQENLSNHTKGIKSPEQIVSDGEAVCRDYSVLYASIFKRLGKLVMFRFLPNHVYVTVYLDDTYCELDYVKTTCVK